MFRVLKSSVLIFFSAVVIFSCGDSNAPQENASKATPEATTAQPVVAVLEAPVAEEPQSEQTGEPVYLENQVVYQEEIYKGWPYTEALAEVMDGVAKETAEDTATEEKAAAGDKPYQLVDGKISENAMNGWRTYNGGGCGTCHGKGGIGAVGPNLANSVGKVLSKDEFIDIVTNGKPGTMMRPHKTNKRVMDNMEDLYVYLLARADDVLGPGNLIKQPLGK